VSDDTTRHDRKGLGRRESHTFDKRIERNQFSRKIETSHNENISKRENSRRGNPFDGRLG
jgi:hypothetical protein